AVILLLLPHAVRLGDPVIRVREQPEVQAVLLAELPVRLDGVRAHAQHDRAARVQVLHAVAELARLDGAAGGVVLGIEVEHDLAATQVGQADGRAVVRLELEVGGDVVRLQHAWAPGRVPGRAIRSLGAEYGVGGAGRQGRAASLGAGRSGPRGERGERGAST